MFEASAQLAVNVTTDRASARAFVERLYAAHHAEIYAYLARMVRDDELAADLAQETFVKAYRAFDTLDDPIAPAPGSTRSPAAPRSTSCAGARSSASSRGPARAAASAASAEELVLRSRLSADLERALAKIPPRQRLALLLAELHGLTGLELADALGVSHVAARALLTRARESLRQALAVERAKAAVEDERRAHVAARLEADADDETNEPIDRGGRS